MQKYLSYADDTVSIPKCEPVIWWCWLQGLESAPPIVKACYILDKWKAGIISNTHFSDILCLELLTSRGGIWVDATVFVTGNESL